MAKRKLTVEAILSLEHYAQRVEERKTQEQLSEKLPISMEDIINLRIELETENIWTCLGEQSS